jgi:hypothetical protein
VVESFTVPNAMAGSIIGTGGENIRSVQSRTGAHVRVDAPAAGQSERTVTVTGTAAAVEGIAGRIGVQLTLDCHALGRELGRPCQSTPLSPTLARLSTRRPWPESGLHRAVAPNVASALRTIVS